MAIEFAIGFVVLIATLVGIYKMIDNGEGNGPPYGPKPINPTSEDPFPFPGTDVYTGWALGAGRLNFFASKKQQEWIPVLLELEGIRASDFALGRTSPDGEPLIQGEDGVERWQSIVRVPGLYTGDADQASDAEPSSPGKVYLTALVREEFFRLFEAKDGEGFINQALRQVVLRSRLGLPLDRAALADLSTFLPPSPKSAPPNNPPQTGTVVVGIIDDGIAFANERFRSAPNKTRIEYVWLQGEYFDTTSPPPDILEGREIKKADIDSRLSAETRGGIVDEHAVYRHFGVEDFSRVRDLARKGHKSTAQRASHGVHVMDVASGYHHADADDRRPMICVQLPTEVTANTSGASLESYLIEAVQYILCRADEIAIERDCGRLPVVINFSYGHSSGPHDGTSASELALDQKVQDRDAPLRIVLPSGNSHLSRTHAQISFRPDLQPPVMERELSWRVQPNDQSPSFLEIWLPRGLPDAPPNDRIELTVKAPGSLGQITLGEMDGHTETIPPSPPQPSDVIFSVSYKYQARSDRGMFLVILQPTEDIESSGFATAPSGVWTVTLTNKTLDEDDLIHAWIQRDDTPFGYPIHGRQSYFDDPKYERFNEGGRFVEQDSVDSYVKRAGTISGLATGDETIVIGGVYRREMRAAEYAAGGPTYDSDRVGPDASAVSGDTPVHRGILAAGTRSGSRVAINGTSVAAPQITRWVADELAGGSNTGGDRTAVKNRAIIEETTPPERPPRPTHERGGAGRIIRPPIEGHDRFER